MSAGITLGKAIAKFDRELGYSREDTIDVITSSVEFLLFNGGGEIWREWKVIARNGKFIFPKDLETPIKFKFSRLPDTGFGSFHSAFYSYSSNGIRNCSGYNDWNPQLEIKANRTPTQFDAPSCGIRLTATSRNSEDVGKKIMVGGKWHGKEIAPIHEGFKTSGELLTIYAENDFDKKYSTFYFDEITSVVKDLTCDWMMLSGVSRSGQAYFLSHYHPDEEIPLYRQGELFVGCCPGLTDLGCDICIHILGKIDPSIRYIRDEDILPITSTDMLMLLVKRAKYDASGDYKEVAAMEQRIKNQVKKQVSYQQASARSMSFNLAGSGCTLTNT